MPANWPWLTAWEGAARELSALASQNVPGAADYMGVAGAAFSAWQAGGGNLSFDALRDPLIARYRDFFMPQALAVPPAAPERARRAFERHSRLVGGIAADAGRRLADTLAASGPAAPPVTTLRELHALWVECGEAAWAAAAHREEFADAQAELLAALVELRAMAPR